MTKKTRDWLFRIFVFLFVIITITLSLYATGYRFNLSWPLRLDRMLLKTGTLALDTEPKGATVFINSETKISSLLPFLGIKKTQITPIKIKNLLPGEYTISFNLENYWPYEKKLRVNPEQTTFLEGVILFKKSLPLNISLVPAQEINYSPNGNYAWLKKENKIIDLKTEEVVATINIEKINWLENGKKVAIGPQILNLDNNHYQDYKLGKAEEIQLSNNGLVIYLSGNSLAALDTKTNSTTIIPTEGKILNYGLNGDNLFIIIANKEKTEINNFNLTTKTFLTSTELITANNFALNQENYKNPILTDNDHKIIYLLAISNGNIIIKDIIRGATVFKWLDANRLAYALESEIYIYDLNQNKSYLITRLSEKINSLTWSADNFLIYSTENNIGTIDLTNNGGNNITTLWQGSNISSLYFNDKTAVLYFSGTIGNQSGLYKIALR